MAHVEKTIIINRPVHEVFEYVVEGRHNPEWRDGILEIRPMDDRPPGRGVRYRQLIRGPLGMRIDGDYEITEFDEDKVMEFAVISGPGRPTGRFEFTEVSGSTQLHFELDYEPTGIAKLAESSIVGQMHVEVGYLSQLKQRLEEKAG